MQNVKMGVIIKRLRLERQMTQLMLAEKMNISDKAVSKWERGLGCPDISLIPELADILGVDTHHLLVGDIVANDFVGGNMKQTKYYVCTTCKNISLCSGAAQVSCCGKKLTALNAQKASEQDKLKVDIIENEYYISSDYPMTKDDYISFVSLATGDSIRLVKQYPEWDLSLRIPRRGHGLLLWYSERLGLLWQAV